MPKKLTNTNYGEEGRDRFFSHCSPFALGTPAKYGGDQGPEVITDERLTDQEAFKMEVWSSELIERLFVYAENGDPLAIRVLVFIASKSTDLLETLAWKNPSLVEDIASKMWKWPANISKKGFVAKDHACLMKRINLGEKCKSKANAQPSKESTQVAMQLKHWLNVNREDIEEVCGLTPLTKDNWGKWFEVAWDRVMAWKNGKPESDPFLRRIGEHQGKQKTISAGLKNPKASIESNIRDRIKGAVEASFRTITKFD